MSDLTLSHMSKSDSFATPKELYQSLDSEFHFNDDPCPLEDRPLLSGKAMVDGLDREWGSATYMNPPYSEPAKWCRKAYLESLKGKTIVGLLRGDTSTKWFHEWVLPYAELRFVKGRLKFNGKPAPFSSIIAIWREK